MGVKLNINTDAVVKFTNRLEKIHRAALPNAVRTALNSVAFDVKKSTLPKHSQKEFINRSPNFFKANSRVEMARGFDLKSMASIVGMVEGGLKGGNNHAVKDLEQQEYGGAIKSKAYIPMAPARSGKSNAKAVRPGNRLSGINRIVNTRNARGKNYGQKFIKSAIHAGKGGYVLAEFKGKEILWRVNSLNRTKKRALKLTPIYSYDKGRSVTVKATHFMRNASIESAKNIPDYFIKEAQRQIQKFK